MYCMNCGEKLPDNASFCSRCGEMCLKPVSGRPASNPNRNAVASSARHNISGKRSPQRQNASSWGIGS
ncbi:MAG: zinc ribbon domain-containing protein, partial [Selenomonadaceae bacterium]|nr:zinc ribbon domain-containing protein [Selenomonadaceae bacterium]